jgi:hypothetical protein
MDPPGNSVPFCCSASLIALEEARREQGGGVGGDREALALAADERSRVDALEPLDLRDDRGVRRLRVGEAGDRDLDHGSRRSTP